MSLRAFIGVVGFVMMIAGGIGLISGVTVGSTGGMTCGSAASPDLTDAKHRDDETELHHIMTGGSVDETDFVAMCTAAISARRTWTIPVALIGLVAGAGALLVRPKGPEVVPPQQPSPSGIS